VTEADPVPSRKRRIPVVFDTNVIVGFYLSRDTKSANQQAFRLWRDQRTLQLIISDELLQEYLEVMRRLGVSELLVKKLEVRFARRETVTHVGLGSRPKMSRDPDDNIVIATARSGKARFLVTNDHDLLDIPQSAQARLRLTIVNPSELLAHIREEE
jgi:putative PIN family toxin of toxin-antitoxin system